MKSIVTELTSLCYSRSGSGHGDNRLWLLAHRLRYHLIYADGVGVSSVSAGGTAQVCKVGLRLLGGQEKNPRLESR